MITLLKNLLKNIPRFNKKNSYSVRGYYSHQLGEEYSSLENYLNLNRLIAEKKEIPINSTLENLKPSLIKKRYGSPFFKVVNDFELFKVQIQFYRIKIGDHKVMLKTHLF